MLQKYFSKKKGGYKSHCELQCWLEARFFSEQKLTWTKENYIEKLNFLRRNYSTLGEISRRIKLSRNDRGGVATPHAVERDESSLAKVSLLSPSPLSPPPLSRYSIRGIRIVLCGDDALVGISRGGEENGGAFVCSAPAAYTRACTRSLVPLIRSWRTCVRLWTPLGEFT